MSLTFYSSLQIIVTQFLQKITSKLYTSTIIILNSLHRQLYRKKTLQQNAIFPFFCRYHGYCIRHNDTKTFPFCEIVQVVAKRQKQKKEKLQRTFFFCLLFLFLYFSYCHNALNDGIWDFLYIFFTILININVLSCYRDL